MAWPAASERPTLLGTAVVLPEPAESLADFLGRLGAKLRVDWLNGVDLVGVEWPFVGENAQSALDLAACCGVGLAAAGERHIPCRLVSPQQAKLALARRGNASKDDMMTAARERFGRELTKDRADAVGIALAALLTTRRARGRSA